MNVGLCWAGGPLHRNDRNRSTEFRDWLPLFRLPVRVHSLQAGDRADDWKDHEYEPGVSEIVTPLQPGDDWHSTAGVIAGLDLVLTVDTAVLHLAGGMGKRCWAALATSPDFRWGLGHDYTPWYPSIRLYRQAKVGEWGEVIARMTTDLEALTCAR